MRRDLPTRPICDRVPTASSTPPTAGGSVSATSSPARPDPDKFPVVLCHGLGLNATFWTITDPRTHLPAQLLARGYEVFLFDFRGSGESSRVGLIGKLNAWGCVRRRSANWARVAGMSMRSAVTTCPRSSSTTSSASRAKDHVNWIGHSLGGMLIFPYCWNSRPRLSGSGSKTSSALGVGDFPGQLAARDRNAGRQSRLPRMLVVVSPARDGSDGPLMIGAAPPGLGAH